ncbi:YihY/virulence factor BrkB family protein [Paracoccus pacificus]|uniref:YihY/virulence factor BrkB family protein n=1 Tax=Paracoccus pacificus TaxID=1463598 RepID=A0ABW4R2T4_9RHOB
MIELLRDIWEFIQALFERMDKIHLSLIAAGVAFYAMFAVFPGLAAIIALWSLVYDPATIQTYVNVADEFIPADAAELLQAQVDALTSGGRTTLGWTTALSFLIATIAARAGVEALVRGLNAIYAVRSHSTIFGFVLAYLLTLAIVGIALLGLATIVIVPLALNFLTLGPLRGWLVAGLPWVAMFLIVMVGIGVLYRYGPNVKTPRTALLTWGSLVAALVWAAASVAFSAYLGSFNSYNRIYGSIGAVVALLMWFYLAGFSVLLGALVNVELARRRRVAAARAARAEIRAEATAKAAKNGDDPAKPGPAAPPS